MALIGTMKYLTIGDKTYEIEGEQLSIASSSTLGGIKVGSGLSIDSTTGVLSTSITETDPVFSASAAAGITSTDISNWNGKTNTNISYNSSSRTLKKTVNGTTSDVVDFGTAAFKLYTTIVTSNGTGLPTSAAVASFVEEKGYITGYTETDPVFSASAAAGITSTDISNWNAKVSDTGKWNDVSLNKTPVSETGKEKVYVPLVTSTSSTTAYLMEATFANGSKAGSLARYNANSYLISTTPSANDNSTKVATTAYVDAAIPNISGFVSKSGDTITGDLILGVKNNNQSKLQLNYSDSNYITLKNNGADGDVGLLILGNQTNTGATTGNVRIRGVNPPVFDYDAANKKYVDDSIPKVYSSTNTGGYLTMATLPIYDGTVV